MQNEHSKAANQAWRKRPRRFAPKSRLGCKTCKIRRVKCDLSQPSCEKCQSTGRTCDGYGQTTPLISAQSNCADKEADKAESFDSYRPCTTLISGHSTRWHAHAQLASHISQDLGPLLVLPATGSAERESMSFFEYISIKHLDEYRPCESWHNTLMLFSQTVPSMRHAAMALALMHRNYRALDRSPNNNNRLHLPPYAIPDRDPLFHYNRAIQLLLDQDTGDSIETTAITLLVCYVFICFDHLARNYVQAMKHLRGGVELLRSIDRASLERNNTPSGLRALISQITRQIGRLDMQAVTFLVDWTPVDLQEMPLPRDISPISVNAFHSLDQAADHLQIIVARVMWLRNMEQQQPQGSTATTESEVTPPSSPSSSQIVGSLLNQLETWSTLFSNMLRQQPPTPSPSPLTPLLHLHHTISYILLRTHAAPDGEMAFDNFFSQFQQCLTWADEITMAHEQTLTPEVGIIPVLYIIGVKCRHPVLRREALRILRLRPVREAVWDSIITARVVERVIDIEEGGGVELGDNAKGIIAREGRDPGPEGVPVWQRVEMVSWVHVVDREDTTGERLDITYTVCGRDGACVESVLL